MQKADLLVDTTAKTKADLLVVAMVGMLDNPSVVQLVDNWVMMKVESMAHRLVVMSVDNLD